jgi:hypothetical protein
LASGSSAGQDVAAATCGEATAVRGGRNVEAIATAPSPIADDPINSQA